MKNVVLIVIFSLVSLYTYAQDSFNQKFLEANTLMEESSFNIALPIWLEILTNQPDNANVNYKIGVCYINSGNEKRKSLKYLKKAVEKTTTNYDPFSSSEKSAPIETHFYLARAYHLNYELDLAISNFNLLKEKITRKHFLYSELEHYIKQCNNAKEAIANPMNIHVQNLGSKINTVYPEYSPVLSLDESTIYFTSRRLRTDSSNYFIKDFNDGLYYEDIYVSNNYDGIWTTPELININTEGHEATINISIDGQTLYIYKDDNGNGNLYYSNLIDDEWSTPSLFGSDINSEFQETHVTVTPDGNTLYFISDRKNGFGGQDIYYCKKLPSGDWAKAQNIGDVINTPYNEDGVFIHPDGKTLYFSSHGHNSIGGYDIFYSSQDKDGIWSTPVNLGYPVNSTDDDIFFVTSADGKRGYYSSFQEKGYGEKDIYMISMNDTEDKPLTLLVGKLKVIGEEETPNDAQIIITDNITGDLIGIFKPRKKDGKFSIILEPEMDYHIVYSAMSFTQEEDLYVPQISTYKEISRGIELQNVIFGDKKDIISYLNGFLEYKKLLSAGTNITLLDEKDQLIETTVTDKNGFFKFKNLNPDEYYMVRIDEVDKDVVEKAKVWVVNSRGEKVILAIKKGKNRRLFKALTSDDINKLPLLDEKDNKYDLEKDSHSANTNIATYQEFFNYNVKQINVSNDNYINLINKVVDHVNQGNKIVLEIEASASKVPTKTFKSNEHLAKFRSEDTKNALVKSLTEKGINPNKYAFKNTKNLVQGPNYKNDFENVDFYEKYQYVTIKVK